MNTNFSSTFWKDVQLKLRPFEMSHPDDRAEQFSTKVCNILSQGCGLTAKVDRYGHAKARRTVPSAGNIYPYEVLVAARGDSDKLCVYKYSIYNNRLNLYLECEIEFEKLTERLLPETGDKIEGLDFAVLILNRPWASIRKYGNRGVFYSFLDCAHATTNITYIASETADYVPIIDTHIESNELCDILDLNKYCSVVQNVIYFPCTKQKTPRIERAQAPEVLMQPSTVSADEREKWDLLKGEGFSVPFSLVKKMTYTSGLRSSNQMNFSISNAIDSGSNDRVSLVDAISKRFSASAFKPTSISSEQVTKILQLSDNRLQRYTSTYKFNGVGLRVIAKNVTGLSGVYDFENGALTKIGKPSTTPDFRSTCMNQKVVENAAALIVLYGPIPDLLSNGTIAELKEAMFSAGQIGQMLYLAATSINVGVSAIGGFDTELCRKLSLVDEEFDPLYVFSLGNVDQTLEKFDRNPESKYYALAEDE